MRRPLVVVLTLALLASLASVPLASAHLNHATADSQVSADGTVVVENVFAATDAHLVLHRVEDGSPAEPIGSVALESGQGLVTSVEVRVEESVWAGWETARVYVVLHRDDGDGTFEPDEDPMLTSFGQPAGSRFTLARGDAPASVVGQGFNPRQVSDGSVPVIRTELGNDGFLVLRRADVAGPGEVVGYTALDAGVHESVSVPVDERYRASSGERLILYAQVYYDDGDGRFDPATDTLVRAGGEPVMTRFEASQPAPDEGVDTSPETTSTEATVTTTDDGPVVNTPPPTSTTEDGPRLNTPSATSTTAPTTTTDTDNTGTTQTRTAGGSESSRVSGPGFGVVVVVGALLAGGALAVRRRRP